MIKLKPVRELIANAIKKYRKDNPVRLAGTTAYFTIFAIAPILIIIISVFGWIIGEEEVSSKAYKEINDIIGEQGTSFIREIVKNYQGRHQGIIGTIVGIVIFLVTSTTFFNILQSNLNYVWKIKSKPRHNLKKALKDRLLSFGIIMVLGLILLATLLIDASVSFLKDYVQVVLKGYTYIFILILNILISYSLTTLIFAIIYKFLPDAKIEWKVTWIGAIITSALFILGKYLIGFALGYIKIGILYGAAGSLVVLLLWVFYSSLIFFLGAEITRQFAEQFSQRIEPKDYAVRISIEEVHEEN